MPEQSSTQVPSTPSPVPQDLISVSRHTVTLSSGERLEYTARAGTVVLREEAEKDGISEGLKPKATLFFTAYTRDGVSDLASRPITFCFNGGPGSSSVWLHLGLFGPRRVEMDPEGFPLAPPYRLLENEYTLLDHTDLVFIDPVSTGYSRAVDGAKASEYHGFKRDLEAVGEFIRLYTSRNGRWLSPKFLAGESYGTTRAAGLAGYLQERHGLYFNGLMLISSILDFGTALFTPGNDLPHALFLPTFTATAFYHGRLPSDLQGDLQTALRESEAFAMGEYTLALMRGDALEDAERAEIARRLARLTGLSEAYLERVNLRPEIHRFVKELLRDQGRTVGRLDSRFTGFDRDAGGEHNEFDPSMSAIMGPYTASMNHYVRADLGFESDLPYEILTGRVQPWSYAEHQNRFVNVAETLRKAMSMNPHLKVLVANGYYDLATPYFATEYTMNHLGVDRSLRGNLSMTYYEAGHMMYIQLAALEALKQDLAEFIGRSAGVSLS
ncbi:carboxypeptidase C (cathepsin A) [Deinobacterium chartae]|uniref:Carboxypeptidase C (Cathepsin A) n=1 Tax=Deinobacterium chartae TaxID=521158 RepID=A0A841HW50_9DEIO|nr:peptidase S10 [Deinobacterium chartae]MBB6097063.1 carboxypeptidase C (cathepsin A) [Deinobacterium chartae]